MRSGRKAFSIFEMIIVLIILGILAAGAIPLYQQYYTRSKRAELYPLTKNIIKALNLRKLETINRTKAPNEEEIGVEAGYGVYGWAEVNAGEEKEWTGLNIRFDGAQRYHYRLDYWQIGYSDGTEKNSIVIEAIASGEYDLDGDDTPDHWVITNDGGFTATNLINDVRD